MIALSPLERFLGSVPLPAHEVTDFIAVTFGHQGRAMLMGIGSTRQQATARALAQYAGVDAMMRAHYAERIRTIAVTADEASEHAECIDADWL